MKQDFPVAPAKVEWRLRYWYYHYNTGSANNGHVWGKRMYPSLEAAQAAAARIQNEPKSVEIADEFCDHGDGTFIEGNLRFEIDKVTTEERFWSFYHL